MCEIVQVTVMEYESLVAVVTSGEQTTPFCSNTRCAKTLSTPRTVESHSFMVFITG